MEQNQQPLEPQFSNSRTLQLGEPINRILAYIIDSIVVGIPAGAVTFPIIFFSMLQASEELGPSSFNEPSFMDVFFGGGSMILTFVTTIISLVFYVIYFIVVPSKFWTGQTLGKKLLGLKIVQESGEDVTLEVMGKRQGLYVVLSFLSAIPFVGVLATCANFIIWVINLIQLFSDPKHQTLHDKLASTVVIEYK